uniref:F-box domain-containing protein n=1 Tax=Kalanchoe fedtschenkoi TaxID=63787 RepID=A0A7N0TI44_KALFE
MDGMLTWLEVSCERWSSCLGKCWDSLTRRRRIIEIYLRRGFSKVGYLIERMMQTSETLAPVFLPDDIMVDILSRLPVRSLARWSCVDKSWKSRIRSRRFIDTYLGRHTEDRLRVLVSPSPHPPFLSIKCRDISKSLIRLSEENVVWLTPSSSPHWSSFSDECYEFGLAGCCDGLLCFHKCLAGRRCNVIFGIRPRGRPSDGCPKMTWQLETSVMKPSRADDYKIMRILRPWPGTLTRVDVLSVGSNTLRRFQVRIRGVFWSEEAVFRHGSLHWLMVINHNSRASSEYFILRFNLETEVMDEVAIHKTVPDCEVLINIVSDLNVVDGRLHVVVEYQKRPLGDSRHTYRGELEMQVMEEYGVETSWTKRLS